jgi:hypothetical protein
MHKTRHLVKCDKENKEIKDQKTTKKDGKDGEIKTRNTEGVKKRGENKKTT